MIGSCHPIIFFSLVYLFTLIFFIIFKSSNRPLLKFPSMILTLATPAIAVFIMIYGSKNHELILDFWQRMQLNKINTSYLPFVLLLMPCVILLATTISLLFGKSAEQFKLSPHLDIFSTKIFLSILILFLAPTLEEIGWRGYGVDSLKCYFNLFNTSIIFAILWSLWHLPAFFVPGYYHNTLWKTSYIHTANWFISILPSSILLNFVYYQSNRSILIIILFHFVINLASMLLRTSQFTKCIATALLIICSIFVVATNQHLFFA